jgi:hypothetical protein
MEADQVFFVESGCFPANKWFLGGFFPLGDSAAMGNPLLLW